MKSIQIIDKTELKSVLVRLEFDSRSYAMHNNRLIIGHSLQDNSIEDIHEARVLNLSSKEVYEFAIKLFTTLIRDKEFNEFIGNTTKKIYRESE